jgi:ComF family protein
MQLFYSLCVLCDSPTETKLVLCQACLAELPYNQSACPYCAEPLLLEQKNSFIPCQSCQQHPPICAKAHAPFLYDTAIRYLIIELKFNKQLLYAHLLGELLANDIQQHFSSSTLPNFLLPIPLHPQRLRKRGFNQAMEICRVLSKRLHIPILSKQLSKVHSTIPQAELSAQQRQNNLKHSFQLKHTLPNARIAIVDDVITTGATINEVAQLLRNSGLKQPIYAWACAKTPAKGQ